MKGELALVIYEDLELVSHELSAYGLDLFSHSGTEHHHLLLGGSALEDSLDYRTKTKV